MRQKCVCASHIFPWSVRLYRRHRRYGRGKGRSRQRHTLRYIYSTYEGTLYLHARSSSRHGSRKAVRPTTPNRVQVFNKGVTGRLGHRTTPLELRCRDDSSTKHLRDLPRRSRHKRPDRLVGVLSGGCHMRLEAFAAKVLDGGGQPLLAVRRGRRCIEARAAATQHTAQPLLEMPCHPVKRIIRDARFHACARAAMERGGGEVTERD